MKPDDIPQEVLSFAEDALRSANIKAHMLGEPTDPIECISLAIMAAEKRGEERSRRNLRQMHRRAQKAEGAANAARFVVELWEKTLANDQRRIMFELTIKVLAEVRQALSRFPSNRGKP